MSFRRSQTVGGWGKCRAGVARRSWWAAGAKGAGEPGAERVQSLHGCGGGKEEFSSPFIVHGGWRMGTSWGQHIAEARAKPPAFAAQGCVFKRGGEMGGKRLLWLTWGGQSEHPYDVPFEPPWRSSLSTQDKAPVPFLPLLDARVPTNPEAAPALIFRLRNLSLWEKIM